MTFYRSTLIVTSLNRFSSDCDRLLVRMVEVTYVNEYYANWQTIFFCKNICNNMIELLWLTTNKMVKLIYDI